MGVVCKKCGSPKPDGGRCRACQRAYTRQRYKDDPESFKKANRRWNKKNPGKKQAQRARWRSNNPETWKRLRKKTSKKWKLSTVRGVLSAALSRRRTSKHEVLVDVDYLVDLWDRQNGLCALTGLPLSLDKGLRKVSVDRIDSAKGYVPGNVQLVRSWVNMAKRHHSNAEFLALLAELRTTQ